MIASEHCSDHLYDSQYHSVKMESDYNFKQESDVLINSKADISNDVNIAMISSISSPSSDMITYQSNQQYQQQQLAQLPQQASWYPPTSNTNQNYSTDDLFYASLPPSAPPLFSFPSPLPKKKQLINRNHPRHRSANGILQQYAHYHYQNTSQQQQFAQTLQRRTSSTTNSTQSSPPSTCNITPSCTTPSMHYASTTSTSSSPTDSLFSAESSTSLKKYHQDDTLKKPSTAPLRYRISLQTSTTAAQRIGEQYPMTYLNRGQAYGIHFEDQQHASKDTLVTSTISIAFHDITHRQASHNYWGFWLSQQDRPNEARALDLDAQQSAGLVSVHYPSFDRISIQWQPQAGATLFVRFNCLSTDFSRIKGVKGIPLRVLVESSSSFEGDSIEKSFCKIKLFRDKGAERKNKDDAKQISKQLEKLKAEGNPQHNPLWHFYNQPVLPYSTFEALPEEDEVVKDDYSQPSTMVSYALPTTSPLISSPLSMISPVQQPFVNNNLIQTYPQDSNMTMSTSFYPAFSYPQPFVPPTSFVFNPMTSPPLAWSNPVIGRKRSRSHLVVSTHPSPPEDHRPTKRSRPALTLLVGTKKDAMDLRRIELDTLSVQQLIVKLSALFSLQAQSVMEVLWRRTDLPKKQPSSVLVLVEDCILEHFVDQSVMQVQWEISSAGMVRFILEF